MSEPTGNEKPAEQPWEMSWVKKPIQAVTDFVTKAVDAVKEPWEMPWKKKATPVSTPVEKPAVAPSKGFSVDDYIQKTAMVESGGNPEAKSEKSSAAGLYQFTAGTWMGMVNKMDLPYTLSDRKDPKKSKEVMRKFTEMNYEKAKQDLGREPNNVDVYMYHFLGNSASTLLKAKGEDVAYKQVSPAQAKANKPVFFHEDGSPKTVNQVLERYMRKFGNNVSVMEDRTPTNVTFISKNPSDHLLLDGAKKDFENMDKRLEKDPEFSAIKSFLESRGAVPQVAYEFHPGRNGSFTQGARVPKEGVIAIRPGLMDSRTENGYSTYVHEHVHAAISEMANIAYELENKTEPLTKEESRFLDTFKKIHRPNRQDENWDSGMKATARAISKEWVSKNEGYRASMGELPAFGVGNQKTTKSTVGFGEEHKAPLHVDATMSQMFMILLDQASKLSKGKKNAS